MAPTLQGRRRDEDADLVHPVLGVRVLVRPEVAGGVIIACVGATPGRPGTAARCSASDCSERNDVFRVSVTR
jgi:hypothetical protein